MEGIEIVITPRLIERIVLGLLIIALAVLLVIKWNGNGCEIAKNETSTTTTTPVQTVPVVNQSQNNTNATKANGLCTNQAKDQDETDVDCGGSTCDPCDDEFATCNLDKDCATGMYCYQHIKCMKPTCSDGVKNQDETNIDCGGKCDGYWWTSDSKCHITQEPSGKLDIKLTASVGKSELSGNAILNSLTMTLDNGLSKTLFLKADIYALTANGKPVFSDQEGNNIPIETVELDGVSSGGKLTKVINFQNSTRKTLVGVKSTDAYQLMVEFHDQENTLIAKKSWTNG
jgi:hypothetical protein